MCFGRLFERLFGTPLQLLCSCLALSLKGFIGLVGTEPFISHLQMAEQQGRHHKENDRTHGS